MGDLASSEIFKNMLQLKRFGLYFEGIMNRKWLLLYRNNDISYRDARGRVANSHAYGVILTHLTCYSRTHAIDKFTHAFKRNHTHTHAIL